MMKSEIVKLMTRLAMLTKAAMEQMDEIDKMLTRLNGISEELGQTITLATSLFTTGGNKDNESTQAINMRKNHDHLKS